MDDGHTHSDINEMWQDFKEAVQKASDCISLQLAMNHKSYQKLIRKINTAFHRKKHSKERNEYNSMLLLRVVFHTIADFCRRSKLLLL